MRKGGTQAMYTVVHQYTAKTTPLPLPGHTGVNQYTRGVEDGCHAGSVHQYTTKKYTTATTRAHRFKAVLQEGIEKGRHAGTLAS